MLKIRLSRTGKKAQKSFKIVVQEHTSPVKSKFVDEIGYYRPATAAKEMKVDTERVTYWMSKGAQPSDTVAVLLKKSGMSGMEKFIGARNKQRKNKKAPPEEVAAPAAPKAEAPTEAPAAEEAAEAPAVPAEEPKAE